MSRPYDHIRESILSGERVSGERIAAQGIATQLGVSRTPVKEAPARLDAEGLVVRTGNWGYSVRVDALAYRKRPCELSRGDRLDPIVGRALVRKPQCSQLFRSNGMTSEPRDAG
jgi:DNA-binding transcriptional MocR family regulator